MSSPCPVCRGSTARHLPHGPAPQSMTHSDEYKPMGMSRWEGAGSGQLRPRSGTPTGAGVEPAPAHALHLPATPLPQCPPPCPPLASRSTQNITLLNCDHKAIARADVKQTGWLGCWGSVCRQPGLGQLPSGTACSGFMQERERSPEGGCGPLRLRGLPSPAGQDASGRFSWGASHRTGSCRMWPASVPPSCPPTCRLLSHVQLAGL